MLEHRDTYGQAQVCSKGHRGSSVDRPCQPSFHWIKFWHVRNPLPQSTRLCFSVLVRYRAWTARESEVYPRRPKMEKKTNAPITPTRPLPGDSAPLGVMNTAATRCGNGSHLKEGGDRSARTHPPYKKTPEGENRLDRGPKFPPWRTAELNLEFKP